MKKILLLMVAFSLPAFAEVSDKINSQAGLYLSGLLAGGLLSLSIRWSIWANIIAVPLVVLFFYFAYDTLADPFVGPAIIQEQGIAYIFALYGSATLALVGAAYGNYLLFKAKRKQLSKA